MKQLDERLSASQDASAKKFGVLKEHMLIFQDALKSEQQNREEFQGRKEEEIVKIDQSLQVTLQAELDARREAEQKGGRDCEDRPVLAGDFTSGAGCEKR